MMSHFLWFSSQFLSTLSTLVNFIQLYWATTGVLVEVREWLVDKHESFLPFFLSIQSEQYISKFFRVLLFFTGLIHVHVFSVFCFFHPPDKFPCFFLLQHIFPGFSLFCFISMVQYIFPVFSFCVFFHRTDTFLSLAKYIGPTAIFWIRPHTLCQEGKMCMFWLEAYQQ